MYRIIICTIASLFLVTSAMAQDTLKVMQYNLLRYGIDCTGIDIAQKTTWLKNVLDFYQPDILAVNEIGSDQAYANRVRIQALTYANMQYAPNTNQTGSDIVNRVFYHADKLEFVRLDRINGAVRDIDAVTLRDKPRAAIGDTLELVVLVAHFKAGSGTSDQNQRATAARNVMAWIDAQGPSLQNYIFAGDFNLGSANEDAWQTLAFNSNTAINFFDPTGRRNGWGASTPEVLTQAPTSSRNDCGVGGGLDDRFDFIITSPAIGARSARIGIEPGSYLPLGNDGRQIYNQEINCTGNQSVPSVVCGDIKRVSDHLPVTVKLLIDFPASIDPQSQFQQNFEIRYQGEEKRPSLYVGNQQDVISGPLDIRLVDIQGKTLWHAFENPAENSWIPLGAFPSGVYVLYIQDAKGRMARYKVIF